MQKFKFIPYDKNLVSRARELRKNTTPAEEKLWLELLKHRELKKFKFTRQKPLGHFIADFYCAALKLAIEVDGELHAFEKGRDGERDNMLELEFGIRVIRVKNKDVLDNYEAVLTTLSKVVASP